jgi:hypothetical protein
MSDSGLDKNTRRMKTAGRWLGYVAVLSAFATVVIFSQSGETSLPLLIVAASAGVIGMALQVSAHRMLKNNQDDDAS